MKTRITLAAVATMALAAAPAFAQEAEPQSTRQQDRLGAIFGALFGDRFGGTDSIEGQWAAGRTPLATQRVQFESRIDTEIRSGALTQATGARLKSDYATLVQLETRYGADGRFTTAERTELADRYGDLTQVLADRQYADGGTAAKAAVADGRAEFDGRVDTAVSGRRISRVQGTRLKTDYAALIQVESGYLRDGVLSERERDDLDERLDALDVRLGDANYAGGAAPATPRSRLDGIARALPSSGLSTTAQAQLRVEHGDLARLETAYARFNASADDRAYLDRRLADLETRARVRRN